MGTFFLGESVVLAASALAAQGTWSVMAVAGCAFAGTVVSDTVWFRSAGSGIKWWTADGERSARLARVSERLDRLAGAHPHRALLVVKFLWGTRIASIVYMALRQVGSNRFVVFDSIGTVLWLAVIIPIGWAIGLGMNSVGADLKRVEWVILSVVLTGAVVKGVKAWRTWRRM